jgi:hypothetical protein
MNIHGASYMLAALATVVIILALTIGFIHA